MDLNKHKKNLIEAIKSDECNSKNAFIALLELEKQSVCYELLLNK